MSYQIYADIIIDISHENLDKTYQYGVPEEFMSSAVIGAPVEVPFGAGNRKIKGYIVGLSREPKIGLDKIKPIGRVFEKDPVIESHLIYLAYWMKETFGGTMIDALKTVMPVKRAVKSKEKEELCRRYPMKKSVDFILNRKRKQCGQGKISGSFTKKQGFGL